MIPTPSPDPVREPKAYQEMLVGRPESYRLTFVLIAGHDRFHVAQAERALAALP